MQKHIRRRESVDAQTAFSSVVHPALAKIYLSRGIGSEEHLVNELVRLSAPNSFKGLRAAAGLIADSIEREEHILIVGDFDADGATSCALSVLALRAMGAAHVDFLVPNRCEHGYGLTPESVAVAAQRTPDLIITVDNGISSIEGVDAANSAGIRVLITDHHLPGSALPKAAAIVNPNQPQCEFPSKCLAGVGVIFYVLSALRSELRERGWFEKQNRSAPNLADFLDLVALGTVADVVPLDRNNRILVAQGLKRIRAGRARPGIRALLAVAGRDATRATASDIAFAIAPRLNAAGRLEDMTLGIECLLTDDEDRARALAQRLDQLNAERRDIEREMHDEARRILERTRLANAPVGVCLYEPSWHQGVIGIVAARVKEQLHRPVVAFARTGDGELKGSARSIPGFHVRDALDTVAARHPDVLKQFGGHAMAAGVSIAERDYAAFAEAFDAVARERLDVDALEQVLVTDGELTPDELCLDLADALRDGGPWGQGFPEPSFDGMFELVECRTVGERHLKLRVQPPGIRRQFDAIAFNTPADYPAGSRARLVYRLDVN